jgi:Ribbon-helix-helix protein, copG family
MATNLRIPPETAELLRERAELSGLSQHAIILDALDTYLSAAQTRPTMQQLIARGLASPPLVPYREATRMLTLPDGVTSLDLLDREDRF